MSIFNIIKSRVSIVDVVNEYTTLKKAGNYLKSRCPFHHEKTGSFTVSPHKEIYYCFGCHSGGDVISFMAKIENCTQMEAARLLADRYNIELPDELPAFQQNQEKKQQYYDVCKAFAHWAHEELKKQPSIKKYLKDRHIDQAQIDYFMIGFVPGGLQAIKRCIAALKKDNILMDDLLEANILAQGKTVTYSPFEDRIIFPIKDHLGRFVGFGGRIYKIDDKRPKYYNSRENDFFTKGSILFGLDNAKKSIQQTGKVFLVEGYTDCVAMVQNDYPNTVATLGTACTLQHLKLLSRYANYVYMLYDSDSAGQQALLRLAQLCWQANMELKVVHLPAGQDPASYLAAGNDLQERIAHAEDIFAFFIASLGQHFSIQPLSEKIERIHSLIDTIKGIQEPLKQDILLQSAARTFDMPFESLKRELQAHPAPPASDELAHEPESDGSIEQEAPSSLEKRLFCAIVNNLELVDTKIDNYIIETMASPLKKILKTILDAKTSMSSFDFAAAFDTLSQDDKKYVSKLLLAFDEPSDSARYEQLKMQFQKQQWKQITRTITSQLNQAQKDGNTKEVHKLLAQYNTLKEKLIATKSA